MSALPKEVEAALRLSARLVLAARIGDEDALRHIYAMAETFTHFLESVRRAQPAKTQALAQRVVTWPCVMRNRAECFSDAKKTLNGLGLAKETPLAAAHLGTVRRCKGQLATDYLNLCVEDSLRDVRTLRLLGKQGVGEEVGCQAANLPSLPEGAAEWAKFAWDVNCRVMVGFWKEPRIAEIMKATVGLKRKEIAEGAKDIRKRGQEAVANGARAIRAASAAVKAAQKEAKAEEDAQQAGRYYVQQRFEEAVKRILVRKSNP